MKTMLTMAGLAFLLGTTTLAVAGEQGCCSTSSSSASVTNGGDKPDTQLGCNLAIENWLNGAHRTCPMRGSGPGAVTRTITREITICRDRKEYTSS